MADQRIQYTENMVGAGHPTLSDTLNRLTLVEHDTDGTHKDVTADSVSVGGVPVVTTTGTETLTNKTLTTPILSATASGTTAGRLGYSGGSFTYGNGTTQLTVADNFSAQTLYNKTLTAPALNDPVVNGPKYTRDDDGTISGGTWAIDYGNGPVIKATAGANITSITMSGWPATGTGGHLRLMLVNFGAYTITFPTEWKWVKSDLTTTTTFADLGLTLPASGTCVVDLFGDDGGTTIYATVLRG